MSALQPSPRVPGLPPPLPDDESLSAPRWSIFAAIANAVIPSFTDGRADRLLQHPLRPTDFNIATRTIHNIAGEQSQDDLALQYLQESATAQPDFRDGVQRTLSLYVDDSARQRLLRLLDILNTRAGSLLLTGHIATLDCLPVTTREEVLQGWAASRLPILRDAHRSLTSLIKLFWLRTSPTLGQVLGYLRVPVQWNPSASSFPFEFLQFPASSEPEIIETDVVIVGSGCGGAVVAKTLAEAGIRVIVVDKSLFWSPEHLPMSERDAANNLFDNGGLLASDDAKMSIIAGSTWGGGGTINWSASLQTQGYVRREWSEKFGLTHFTSSQFQADMDAVCERMGVGIANVEHNKTSAVLLDGSRNLGWTAKTVPQNTADHSHSDGYCTLGCSSGGKQGPTTTFLPDAAKAGALFIEGLEVTELLFAEDTRESTSRVVEGVKGIWTSRDVHGSVAGSAVQRKEIVIKAPQIIMAAGTLRTPVLLQRAGIKNRHIGRHLHLHPVSFVGATWDEDVKPWEGPILTSVVNEFENIDGEGYGTKLEAMTMLPSWFLTSFPWHSGLQWKEFAAKMRRMTGYIALARDRYGGRVSPDPSDPGRCTISYSPHPTDRAHILAGIVALAQIVYVSGAREIHTTVPNIPPFIRPSSDPQAKIHVSSLTRPSINDIEFTTWLNDLKQKGLSGDACFASAHQMGTCRMGTTPRNSVVDPRGRVWGVQGLYVADASVFPSASGVNPMVTVMAISRGIANAIVEEVLGLSSLATDVRARL